MSPHSDAKVDTRTSPDVAIHVLPKKKSLGIVYMPLSETMEAMYQQLMDDGLVSEGRVSRWGHFCSQEEGIEDGKQASTGVPTTDYKGLQRTSETSLIVESKRMA
jgi:hypothetical protein